LRNDSKEESVGRTTHFHACTLCETGCGLAFDVENGAIVGVRPDHEDVFSSGFVCPKGMAIAAVGDDPDRLRSPVRRKPSGEWEPITWDDAIDLVCTRLKATQRAHGRDAVAVYMGTPLVHKHSALLLRNALLSAIGTENELP
jgi:anaerobic selenocysteine-containing dehydrogenase